VCFTAAAATAMTSNDTSDNDLADRLLEPAFRCARGEVPANVALTQMFMAAASADDARGALEAAIRDFHTDDPDAQRDGLRRLGRMRELWDQTPGAFDSVKAVMRTVDHTDIHGRRTAPEIWGARFDRAARVSAEASVALYCLGRADLLRAATDEILQRMRSWNLLAPDASVLDLGCGSGRIIEALAHHVGSAIGVDVSMGMLQAARERCANCSNVLFVRTSGHDLAVLTDESIDVVCAADVFPYFVMSGLAQHQLCEAARVLRRDGHLLILNYSYRGNPADNRDELQRLACSTGLDLRHSGAQEFALWDGTCFLLQKSSGRNVQDHCRLACS
jgi:SAM-dependent methyltransferase